MSYYDLGEILSYLVHRKKKGNDMDVHYLENGKTYHIKIDVDEECNHDYSETNVCGKCGGKQQ